MLNVLRVFGLKKISSYDIVACPQIKSKNTNYPSCTILRFINRKIVNYCLSNRKYITECKHYLKMNLRFYDYLTVINKYILKEYIELKKEGMIKGYVVRNGKIKVFVKDGSKSKGINHQDEFYNLFPEIYF